MVCNAERYSMICSLYDHEVFLKNMRGKKRKWNIMTKDTMIEATCAWLCSTPVKVADVKYMSDFGLFTIVARHVCKQ